MAGQLARYARAVASWGQQSSVMAAKPSLIAYAQIGIERREKTT